MLRAFLHVTSCTKQNRIAATIRKSKQNKEPLEQESDCHTLNMDLVKDSKRFHKMKKVLPIYVTLSWIFFYYPGPTYSCLGRKPKKRKKESKKVYTEVANYLDFC